MLTAVARNLDLAVVTENVDHFQTFVDVTVETY